MKIVRFCDTLYKIAVMEVSRPVPRPDYMGLGFVSVLRFKCFGLAWDYSSETTRPEGKNENKGMKKALGRW